MAAFLSSRGCGTVDAILGTRADRVVDLFAYIRHLDDYAATEAALNKKEETS